MERKKRVLLCVQPVLYESALAQLLEATNDHVSVSRCGVAASCESFDVAVVTGELPSGAHASCIVRLPATTSGTGEMTIVEGDSTSVVELSGVRDLLRVISELVRAS